VLTTTMLFHRYVLYINDDVTNNIKHI